MGFDEDCTIKSAAALEAAARIGRLKRIVFVGLHAVRNIAVNLMWLIRK